MAEKKLDVITQTGWKNEREKEKELKQDQMAIFKFAEAWLCIEWWMSLEPSTSETCWAGQDKTSTWQMPQDFHGTFEGKEVMIMTCLVIRKPRMCSITMSEFIWVKKGTALAAQR